MFMRESASLRNFLWHLKLRIKKPSDVIFNSEFGLWFLPHIYKRMSVFIAPNIDFSSPFIVII